MNSKIKLSDQCILTNSSMDKIGKKTNQRDSVAVVRFVGVCPQVPHVLDAAAISGTLTKTTKNLDSGPTFTSVS
jgi:hypothetical protein